MRLSPAAAIWSDDARYAFVPLPAATSSFHRLECPRYSCDEPASALRSPYPEHPQEPLPASAGVLETGPDHALMAERRLILRVTGLVLRRFSQQLPVQVARVFLRRLMCVREGDAPDWLRIFSLEILRALCLDVPLLKSLCDGGGSAACGGAGGAAGGANILAELTALLGKIAVRGCDPSHPVRHRATASRPFASASIALPPPFRRAWLLRYQKPVEQPVALLTDDPRRLSVHSWLPRRGPRI